MLTLFKVEKMQLFQKFVQVSYGLMMYDRQSLRTTTTEWFRQWDLLY